MSDTSRLCTCGHEQAKHIGLAYECLSESQCSCKAWMHAVQNVTPRTSIDQPPPSPEDAMKPAVWDLVQVDMCERNHVGRARYGTPLQPNNGRDALKDAYAEALDLAVYLRQAIYERDSK